MGPMGKEDKNGMDYHESKLVARLELEFRSSKAYKHSCQNVNNIMNQLLLLLLLLLLLSSSS